MISPRVKRIHAPIVRTGLQGDLRRVRPAATMIATGLHDPRMKIEIEVTARRRATQLP